MGYDDRAVMAANNNADLYEAVFAAHGLRYERHPYAFVGQDRPPPYYSNLTVLSANHRDEIVSELRQLAHRFDGAVGLKDSFCRLDLRDNGFEVLFEASWIYKAAAAGSVPDGWWRIDNPHDLEQWEDAWKRWGSPTRVRMFNEAMLRNPAIWFFGKAKSGTFEAGCIANRSAACIGISNVYSSSSADGAFVEATAAVAAIDKDLPVVGYEAGDALDYAKRAGFETVGDLRILVAEAARF